MVIESAQMLANAYDLNTLAQPDCPRTQKGGVRKHSHPHHPCTQWATQNIENWTWLLEHAEELAREYKYRSIHGKPHFIESFITWCRNNLPCLPPGEITEPPLAMPEEYKSENLVESYRKLYIYDKAVNVKPFCYSRREMPAWLGKGLGMYILGL